MESSLTLLYTHNLRGDLELLPRLFSFIQQLRTSINERTILIDIGNSCDPQVWPCNVTHGRSTLFVLEAMGYHAVNIDNLLTPEHREKMRKQVMMALIDKGHPHTEQGICFVADERDDNQVSDLCILMKPAASTAKEGRVLRIAPVESGQVGIIQLEGDRLRHKVRVMSPATPINPTITGAVDFVVAEARQLARKMES